MDTVTIDSGSSNARKVYDLTNVDLRELVKGAYRHSNPVGLGLIHYREGELDDETIDKVIWWDKMHVIDIDYLHGRCVKFHVVNAEHPHWQHLLDVPDGVKYFTPTRWYDHTDGQLVDLITEAKSRTEAKANS